MQQPGLLLRLTGGLGPGCPVEQASVAQKVEVFGVDLDEIAAGTGVDHPRVFVTVAQRTAQPCEVGLQ